jgi:hypothetical protein
MKNSINPRSFYDKHNHQARTKLWEPVLNGKIYCSPACGHGCTLDDYDRTVVDADKLVGLLRGSGWKAVIHENIGWHYKAISGPIVVFCEHRMEKDAYWCMIAQSVDLVGSGFPPWSCAPSPGKALLHKDPNEAVSEVLHRAGLWTFNLLESLLAASRSSGIEIGDFLRPSGNIIPEHEELIDKLRWAWARLRGEITGG